MEWISKCPKLVVDTETTGLHPWEGDRLVGIAVRGEGRSFYFPFRHAAGENLDEDHISDFAPILSSPKKDFTGFNYDFDLQIMYQDGIPLPPRFHDPMLSSQLLNENEKSFRLKDLCDKYRGTDSSAEEQYLLGLLKQRGLSQGKEKDKGNLWKLRPEDVAAYACADVDLTEWLEDFHQEPLTRWGIHHIWEELCEYSHVITESEILGMQLDMPLVQQLADSSKPEAESRKQRLRDIFELPNLNPNSVPQLRLVTGLPSTKRRVLERMPETEWAKVLLEYRGWDKARSTYYDPYVTMADPNGVLHCSVNMIGTVGPRLSVSHPNLQAVPRQTETYPVKKVFKARPGYVMVELDLSQAEMRVGCHYAQERRMGAILKRGGDMHAETQKLMGRGGVKVDRDDAKRINFSVLYGIGKRSLSENLDITQARAATYLTAYHSAFPGFRKLYRYMEEIAQRRGYIRLFTGRLRHYGPQYLNLDYHKAMSNLVQGTVGEMIRLIQLRIARELPEVRQLLQVHDSLLAELPEEQWVELAFRMAEIMEDFKQFDPAPLVEIKAGRRWGEMHTLKGYHRMDDLTRRRAMRTNRIPKEYWDAPAAA